MRSVAWCLGVAALAGGCGARGDGHPPEPLRVAAASDLQSALPAVVERFRRGRSVEVATTFGSSGQLARQIEQGAPFDVFLSADGRLVEGLARQGIVRPESVRPYGVGSLSLVVDERTKLDVARLADLTRPEVRRIALANPSHAPYGVAARQALERAGLWSDVEPKVVYAESIRQALQFVATGNAEVGLVAHALTPPPHLRSIAIDPRGHDPVVQVLGIVAGSERVEDARAFARFLLGDEGQRLLAGFGFRRAEERPEDRHAN